MDNIILLKSKDKKKVFSFLRNHPISTIFIHELIEYKGLVNNGEPDHGDFYGIFQNSNLTGIVIVYNMGISIVCGTASANIISKNINKTDFTIRRNLSDKTNNNIVKHELLMMLSQKKIMPYNHSRIFIPDKSDIENILNIRLSFESEYWNYIPDTYHKDKFRNTVTDKIKNGNAIIYRQNDKIIGAGFCETENSKCGLIGSIYVSEEFRGLGVGKSITLALCDELLRRKKIPVLTVDINNSNALKLYNKIGFRTLSDIYLLERK